MTPRDRSRRPPALGYASAELDDVDYHVPGSIMLLGFVLGSVFGIALVMAFFYLMFRYW